MKISRSSSVFIRLITFVIWLDFSMLLIDRFELKDISFMAFKEVAGSNTALTKPPEIKIFCKLSQLLLPGNFGLNRL